MRVKTREFHKKLDQYVDYEVKTKNLKINEGRLKKNEDPGN